MSRLQTTLEGELKTALQDPNALAARAALNAAYAGTGMVRYPYGTLQGVAQTQPSDLSAFFRTHFVQSNFIVAGVSPLPPQEFESILKQKFSAIPRGVQTTPQISAPAFQGRRAIIVHQDEMATVPAFVVTPGVSDAAPLMTSLELGNFVLGEDATSRLFLELRGKNGWTYGAYSGYRQLISPKAQTGLFSAFLFPSAEFAGQAISKTVSMLEDFFKTGITSSEFEEARDALSNRYPFFTDTPEKRLNLRVREALTGRHFQPTPEYRRSLAALTLKDVNQALARPQDTPMLIVAVGDQAMLKPLLSAIPFVESVQSVDIDP